MPYLIDGEVIDTYGGDFTYRHVYYEIEDGEYIFYEYHTGAKPMETERITDPSEIEELMREIN